MTNFSLIELIQTMAMPALAAAVVWGDSLRRTSNLESRQAEDRETLDDHIEVDDRIHTATVDRLARLETKIDILLQNHRRESQ